jgi:hypothetical protein
MPWTRAIPSLLYMSASAVSPIACFVSIPDGKDTSGLRKTRLLLYATDPLLEDGGDLGRRCLVGVCAGESVDDGGCGALLYEEVMLARLSLKAKQSRELPVFCNRHVLELSKHSKYPSRHLPHAIEHSVHHIDTR